MANTHRINFVSTDVTVENANGANSLSITSSGFTVEFWVQVDNYTDNGVNPRFIHITDATNGLQILRGSTAARIHTKHTQTNAGNDSIKWGAADLATGTWYHIEVVVNGSGAVAAVYQALTTDSAHTSLTNGGAGDAVGAGGAAASNIFLGDRNDNAAYLEGSMDEVRVWNTQRTATELDANFKCQMVGNETGLVHLYKLNNAYTDNGSAAQNLAAQNTPTFETTSLPFTDECVTTSTTSSSSTTTTTSSTTSTTTSSSTTSTTTSSSSTTSTTTSSSSTTSTTTSSSSTTSTTSSTSSTTSTTSSTSSSSSTSSTTSTTSSTTSTTSSTSSSTSSTTSGYPYMTPEVDLMEVTPIIDIRENEQTSPTPSVDIKDNEQTSPTPIVELWPNL